MIVIGVDPGKHTGIGICENGVLEELFETDFWGAVDVLKQHEHAVIVIELPATKHVWHDGAKNKRAIQRTGVNVGSALREAELLIDWAERNKRNYIAQKPAGKLDGEKFKRITGWQGRTNQHMRDAGMLCFALKG